MYLSKRLRFFFRFILAVFEKQYKLVILGLCLGILFYFLFPKLLKYFPKPKRTIKTGIVGQYTIDNLPDEILNDISFGLTKITKSGEVEPALADSWTISDDKKTFIFKITKNNIFWHDNKIFEIKDINYNFKDITYSIEKDNISFFLKEPFSPFPNVLSRPLFRKGLIGLGDYKIKKFVKKGKYVESVLLNPYRKSDYPNKLYRFYKSENELKNGFNLGEVDEIKGIFNTNGISLGNSIKISKTILNNVYLGIFFDTNRPPFSDKTFRQALAYSILKETGEDRAIGPLNPENWAYNPDIKPYKQDIEKAKNLLGKEIVENKIVISTLPQYPEVAYQIKSDWELIGIDSEVKIVSFVPEDFDILLIAREIPKDPDQYYFWHSTQAGNITNFKSPRIDKLLEDGRKTFDKEERKSIYFDFQRFLVEESPVIFLSHPITYRVVRD